MYIQMSGKSAVKEITAEERWSRETGLQFELEVRFQLYIAAWQSTSKLSDSNNNHLLSLKILWTDRAQQSGSSAPHKFSLGLQLSEAWLGGNVHDDSCLVSYGMAGRLGSAVRSRQLGPALHVVSGPCPFWVACPCGLSHGLSSRGARLLTWQLRAPQNQKQKLPGHPKVQSWHSVPSDTFCWLKRATGPKEVKCGRGPHKGWALGGRALWGSAPQASAMVWHSDLREMEKVKWCCSKRPHRGPETGMCVGVWGMQSLLWLGLSRELRWRQPGAGAPQPTGHGKGFRSYS